MLWLCAYPYDELSFRGICSCIAHLFLLINELEDPHSDLVHTWKLLLTLWLGLIALHLSAEVL